MAKRVQELVLKRGEIESQFRLFWVPNFAHIATQFRPY